LPSAEEDMDVAIAEEKYERTVTLGYTCLEGFLKAFFRSKFPFDECPNEITALAKQVKEYLKNENPEYPDELLNLVSQTAHAVNRTRDRFSESHFGGEAGPWVAQYVRDIVNTQIRLLLHFI